MPGRGYQRRRVADLAAVLSVPVAPAVDEPARRKTKRGRPVMETLTNARSESLYDKSVHA